MAGGQAVARAAGLVAKAAVDGGLRDAERLAVRDGAQTAARDVAADAGRSALSDAERTATRELSKSAEGAARRSSSGSVAEAARTRAGQAIRNDSGLPRTAETAEARRAFDAAHDSEPKWGSVAEGYHGPPPADMTRPHGHHTVYKRGAAGPVRNVVDESKSILEKHGIDWYTGPENLGWAANRGHSLANAEAVRDLLRAADGRGRDAVVDALRTARRTVFGGWP